MATRSGGLTGPVGVSVLGTLVLYLLATGRWGSYVGLPGMPVYVGDVALGLALCQTGFIMRRTGTRVVDVGSALARAPMVLLFSSALLGWSTLRLLGNLIAGVDAPLTTLRDFAPYAYVATALLAFILPTADGPAQRRLAYGALTAHAAWIVLGPRLPGWPGSVPLLGGSPIFTSRPDFDSLVLGIAIAFGLHDLLIGTRERRRLPTLLVTLFIALNAYAVTTQPTRAGFLAGVLGVGTILVVWAMRDIAHRSAPPTALVRRVATLLAALLVLAASIAVSPPGQRVVQGVQGLRGEATQASGTIEVRQFVWGGVTDYVTASAYRTSVGVGFGPDFIDASGTAYALEGTVYKDVRSPHNYIIGTFARLGVVGACLAGLVIIAGAITAVRRLTTPCGAVSVVAALILLTLPVTAMLGVVLESPFGAIPYFWAVGHLARVQWRPQSGSSRTSPSRRKPRHARRTSGGLWRCLLEATSRPSSPAR